MATYSSNTTIKVNAAISASATRGTIGTTTVYTNPSATGYALINMTLWVTSGTSIVTNIDIGGQRFITYTANGGPAPNYQFNGVVIGPSQALTLNVSGGSGATSSNIYISGVLFSNTP